MRCRGDLERCGPAPSRRDAAPTESLRDFHGNDHGARATPDEAWGITIDPVKALSIARNRSMLSLQGDGR